MPFGDGILCPPSSLPPPSSNPFIFNKTQPLQPTTHNTQNLFRPIQKKEMIRSNKFPSAAAAVFYVLTLLAIVAIVTTTAEANDVPGGTVEEEIVIPWKKLYRPRGPPRFGKRAFVLLDDETVPVAWRKRLS